MSIRMRSYDHETDYDAISQFLVRIYQTDPPRNWLQPRWVYAHSHPMMQKENLDKIPIWEDDGEIVATVLYEDKVGANHAQLDPHFPSLKREMLEYAATNMAGDMKAGRGTYVFLSDSDREFGEVAEELGFEPKPQHAEPTSRYAIPTSLPEILVPDNQAPDNPVPDGFQLQSLADEFASRRKMNSRIVEGSYQSQG